MMAANTSECVMAFPSPARCGLHLPCVGSHKRPGLVAALVAALLSGGIASAAENPEIARHRAAERRDFNDAEIIDGFFKIMFTAEFLPGGRADRIRKYDEPVRIYISNRGRPDRSKPTAAVVADIGARVKNLDIAVVGARTDANVVVTLVRDRDLARTIRSVYGNERARRIQRSLDPQCLSGFRKDDSFRIRHSEVILVVDAGAFVFYDCAYEELLQALGPINDDATVPWTMFNDDVQFGFFSVYDQYLLNLLYHPRIKPGMTRDEVRPVLTEILPEVRAFVAEKNGLPR
jgi:hypothetical protein